MNLKKSSKQPWNKPWVTGSMTDTIMECVYRNSATGISTHGIYDVVSLRFPAQSKFRAVQRRSNFLSLLTNLRSKGLINTDAKHVNRLNHDGQTACVVKFGEHPAPPVPDPYYSNSRMGRKPVKRKESGDPVHGARSWRTKGPKHNAPAKAAKAVKKETKTLTAKKVESVKVEEVRFSPDGKELNVALTIRFRIQVG